MKDYTISIDGIGFFDTYTVKAKDLPTAKKKAKALAIRDFSKTLKAYKEN